MYNITLKRIRETIVAVEKAISNTQPVCVFVALAMQHAMCMHHTVICRLPHSDSVFPHYVINGMIFKKKLWNIKYVFQFSLQLLSEIFFILRRIQ